MMEPEQVQRFTREVRALGKAAAHDPEALAQAYEIADELAYCLGRAAGRLNADGFSWQQIGAALGVPRQVAHRWFANLPK